MKKHFIDQCFSFIILINESNNGLMEKLSTTDRFYNPKNGPIILKCH